VSALLSDQHVNAKMDTSSDTSVGNHRAAAEPRFTWAGGATRVFILVLIGALVLVLASQVTQTPVRRRRH
jgi:hypothetical protein